jgi:hypothetical protein
LEKGFRRKTLLMVNSDVIRIPSTVPTGVAMLPLLKLLEALNVGGIEHLQRGLPSQLTLHIDWFMKHVHRHHHVIFRVI